MQTAEHAGPVQNVKMIAVVAAAVLLLIFAFQNIEPATVTFLIWTWTMPRVFVLLVFFVTGYALGAMTPALIRALRGTETNPKHP
jgi:uncharacterized integral membrane protein